MTETKIQARWYAKGPRRNPIDLVVVHTMEAAEKGTTAENVARYFATTATKASAHWCVDNDSEVRCVDDADIAYHAPGASHRSIGIEHAGYARQTAAEWADAYSTAMLARSAAITARICRQYGIPVRVVNAAGVKAGEAGITTHAAVTQAYPEKGHGHWDPGPHFPLAAYLANVARLLAPVTPVPSPSPAIDEHLPILGADPLVTVDQAVAAFVRGAADANGYTDADIALIVRAYSATARLAGIPLGVVLGQLAHETGWLTSEWSARNRRNPAGIGVTSQHVAGFPDRPPTAVLPANHEWQWIRSRPGRPADRWESGVVFPRWAPDAVDAHVGRLAGYAVPVGAETHEQARLIELAARWRPIPLSVRGSARTLRELGQAHNPKGIGWAKPGTTYGAEIAERIRDIRAG